MIKEFVAISNSTIWDVVNNTYGTVDNIVRLMRDNNFANVNTYPENEQIFLFEDTLVQNQNNLQVNQGYRKYATRNRTSTNFENMIKYERVENMDYTSNADGVTVISIPSLVGVRVVQLELEIRPLKTTEWGFNSSSGTISLLGGLTLDNEQTLYIIYSLTKLI